MQGVGNLEPSPHCACLQSRRPCLLFCRFMISPGKELRYRLAQLKPSPLLNMAKVEESF